VKPPVLKVRNLPSSSEFPLPPQRLAFDPCLSPTSTYRFLDAIISENLPVPLFAKEEIDFHRAAESTTEYYGLIVFWIVEAADSSKATGYFIHAFKPAQSVGQYF